MKIFFRIMAMLLCVGLLAGCGAKETAVPASAPAPVPEKKAETVPEADAEAVEIKTFLDKYVNTDQRPVAVMIDNDDNNARPQAGIESAYLIYEIVVEGGATRFMALFRGDGPEKIGPVRSSRHYFIDFSMENDAIYTHFGWSPQAGADITAFGINKINGILSTDESAFWREEKFKGDWHSAYTSMEKIRAMADKKGYASETEHKNSIKYAEKYIKLSGENSAKEIKLVYSQRYNTGYVYNAEKGVYTKLINGSEHKVQSGGAVEVKNIIIEFITDTSLGDGSARRNINTAVSGKGYYITNGNYEEITWSKPSRKGNTVYKRSDGTELQINPGKTIINLFNPASEFSVK